MSNDFDLNKVRRFTKQRVDKDGYIVEETWYGKYEWGEYREEQGSHEIKLEDGSKFYTSSKLEKDYCCQERDRINEEKDLKRRYPQLYRE